MISFRVFALLLSFLTHCLGFLTVPANRLDRTLALREEVGDHYWPSNLPSQFKDDVTASMCIGQSLLTRYSREQWSMQMWDASGTALVGTRAGAHQARGHQELCTKVQKVLSGTIFQEMDALIHRPLYLQETLDNLNPLALNVTPPPVVGRYCVVSIRSKNDIAMFSTGSSELLASLSNHNTPKYAVCVPDTCSEDLLQTWFQKLEGRSATVKVKCTTKFTEFNGGSNKKENLLKPAKRETSDIRFNLSTSTNNSNLFTTVESKNVTTSAILFGIFAGIIIFLASGATIVDFFLQSEDWFNTPQNQQQNPVYGWNILKCFSVQRNWEKIFPQTRSKHEIPVIDGLRCVCMFWVIIAHRYMLMLVTSSYPQDLLQNRNNPNYWWLFNPYPSVDVFFSIAGFLLALSPIPKVSTGALLKTYVCRYLRLCPAVIVTIWGVSSVLIHLGTGPIWDSLYQGFFGRTCEKSWLSSVLLMSNINHPNDMCMGHLWSLSVDWQLSIVGLLVLVPLHTEVSLQKRYLPLVVATCIAIIMPGIITFTYSLPVLPSMSSVKKSLDFYNYYYVNTLCRAAPYFIGVIGGRLHLYLKENPELLSNKCVRLGRAVSVFILSGVMISPMFIPKNELALTIAHNTVSKPCFAAAVLFLIITSYHGNGGILGWVLSRPCVGLLARCSYCIYLVSFPIQVWSSATDSTLPSQGIIQIYACAGDLLLSIISGIVMTLLVELPAAQLLGTALKSKKRESNTKNKEESKLFTEKLVLEAPVQQEKNPSTDLKTKFEPEIRDTELRKRTVTPSEDSS